MARRRRVCRQPERIPRAGQVWLWRYGRNLRGKRKFVRIVSVQGKSRQIVFARGAAHRPPADARFIDVSSSDRPKHGAYVGSGGWTQHYNDRKNPGSIDLMADGPEWIMPDGWTLQENGDD